MSFKLDGDILTTPQNTTFNVFNQHSKQDILRKKYKTILRKKVNQFLKKADDDVDKYDVLRHLEQQGLTNDRITSSENYKEIVKKALDDDKPIAVGGAKKKRKRRNINAPDTASGKALIYLESNIRPRLSVQKYD